MPKLGEQYVNGVHWILRAAIGSVVVAAILGWIIGYFAHQPFVKVAGIVFIVLMIIEIVFHTLQNRK